MARVARFVALICFVPILYGCEKKTDGPSASDVDQTQPPLVVSNSYLAAATRDLLGDDVPLMLLAEPGMCPGHFDLRPSQVRQLRRSSALIRFDFQSALDRRLESHGNHGPHVIAVRVPGGMCDPQSYRSVCQQLAEALVTQHHCSRADADKAMERIAERMRRLDDWAIQQIAGAGLKGAPVLCSGHQELFCRHLGLDVIATFAAADIARPSEIDAAIRAGEAANVKQIVANLPEGRQLADALGDRLGAEVVVFGNFPVGLESEAFDELVSHNVVSFVEARHP